MTEESIRVCCVHCGATWTAANGIGASTGCPSCGRAVETVGRRHDGREVAAFFQEAIERGQNDPRLGVEALAALVETLRSTAGAMGDDGDVAEARDLLVHAADAISYLSGQVVQDAAVISALAGDVDDARRGKGVESCRRGLQCGDCDILSCENARAVFVVIGIDDGKILLCEVHDEHEPAVASFDRARAVFGGSCAALCSRKLNASGWPESDGERGDGDGDTK